MPLSRHIPIGREDAIAAFLIFMCVPRAIFLQMHLLINYLACPDVERVEVDAIIEREDGITNGGIIGSAKIFGRRTRGRGWVAVPIGEDGELMGSGIAQGCELLLRVKSEVFGRMVDVRHGIVLRYFAIASKEVATGL